MAEIHIVLATYNGAKFIKEQLDSILNNSWKDLTIEVCDDGSTDETLEIVSKYVKTYDNVTLHRNEKNLGYVMNFMEGIKRSQSPYIMLCDQDDIWHVDKIQKTYNRMRELEKEMSSQVPLLVYSDAMNFDSDTGEELGSFHKSSHLDTEKVDLAHLLMENKCIGCTVMVNGVIRDYLKELSPAIRVHDWWLALICSCFGKIAYLDESTLQYRQHSGNMIGGSGFSTYVGNRLKNMQKQKLAIRATFEQGKAFYQTFSGQLENDAKDVLATFARMDAAGFLRRRLWLVQYGFWKSGIVRNVALFFMI
nr:glycosyltransferase family 2 protein [Eubacterium sp.]